VARILIIHGAFSGAWAWERALPVLRAAGHDATAIDLPGSGSDRTPVAEVSLSAYAKRVCDALSETEPTLLVGHSMGGMVVTQAAGLRPERVHSLAYVTAFVPADGQSVADLTAYPEAAGDQVQANLVVSGDPPVAVLPPKAAEHARCNCCTAEQARWACEHLRPQPVAPFTQPVRIPAANRAAFERLPRAYVVCTEDRAIMPALQRRMAREAGCAPVIEIDSDHVPFVSRIDPLIAALDQIAQTIVNAPNRPH
jgi:pimeloyl-ACP methyl ester carboxylesterase